MTNRRPQDIFHERGHMYDCTTDDEEVTITNEIEMYQHVEPIEAPTNGLDEFIDWDALEKGLAAREFLSQSDFRAEVKAMFEEAGETFTRRRYRTAIGGMFPEYRRKYRKLKNNGVISAHRRAKVAA